MLEVKLEEELEARLETFINPLLEPYYGTLFRKPLFNKKYALKITVLLGGKPPSGYGSIREIMRFERDNAPEE